MCGGVFALLRARVRLDKNSQFEMERSEIPVKSSYARSLLQRVVQWLESGDEKTSDDAWEDRAFDIAECISELNQRRRPLHSRDKTGSERGPQYDADAPKYTIAIPILEKMLREIRRRDRHAALESGRTALAELPLV